MQASVIDSLRQCDTATICNVIELFEIRPRNRGFMDRRVKAAFPDLPPVVGFAATATCRTFTEKPTRDVPIVPDLISRFADLDGPAVVVMQNLDTDGAAAIFGDVLCNSFKAFGATGLVTDGPGRDLDQVRAIDFPVFCNGIVAAHGYMHLLDLQSSTSSRWHRRKSKYLAAWRWQRRYHHPAGYRAGCGRCLHRIRQVGSGGH